MENNNNERRIRDVLKQEVGTFISTAVILVALFTAFFNLQMRLALIEKDVENITDNHLKHIEKLYEEVDENDEELKELLIRIERLFGKFGVD